MDTFFLSEDIFIILFAAACLVAISETLLITFWNRFYFELGIPTFKYSVKYPYKSEMIEEERLNKIDDDKSLVKIIFKEHSRDIFMFREAFTWESKGLRGGYTLMIRGMLYFDEVDSQITVYGILNMYPIFFSLLFIALAFMGSTFGIIMCLLVFTFNISIYLIQLKRYKSIARRVAVILEEN